MTQRFSRNMTDSRLAAHFRELEAEYRSAAEGLVELLDPVAGYGELIGHTAWERQRRENG